MTVERAVYSFAGTMILISLLLVVFVSQKWLFFTAFIGLNLLQSGFTGMCPAAFIFRRLGLRRERDLGEAGCCK